MNLQLHSYELSLIADHDLNEIYDYTEKEYGHNRAVQYLRDLEQVFESLVKNPNSGKARDEIRLNLRSLIFGSHVVFYRINADKIRIIRILHHSRDIKNFL